MSRSESELAYRQLRAPTDDGALLEPPLAKFADWIAHNRNSTPVATILDRDISQVASLARRELVEIASQHTRQYADPPQVDAQSSLLLGGHQPELFHPGVWFKNFVLSRAAKMTGAVAVNIVVDGDLCRSTAITSPQLHSSGDVDFEVVPFDAHTDPLPFELRPVVDGDQFAKFGGVIERRSRRFSPSPIIRWLWPRAVDAQRAGMPLGHCLAAARHQLELHLGLQTLEAPLSRLANAESFHWFLADLLLRAEDFRFAHNSALLAYRRVNRVRSQSHPAPPLEAQDEFIETPFWIWKSDQPQRRRLFIRQDAPGKWSLTGENGWRETVEFDPSRGDSAAAAMGQLRARGVSIRPRAFTTTLFARLFCGDLFVHGIGGAKYDQMTDQLIRQFYGVTPPMLAVATCTQRLPLPALDADERDLVALSHRLRGFRFHPEKWLANDTKQIAEVADLVNRKREWIGQSPPRGAGKPRQTALAEINERLQPYLHSQRAAAQDELQRVREQVRTNRRLTSREYSFCLHDLTTLPPRLLELCEKGS